MQHNEEEIYYQIALSFVSNIGPKMATGLIAEFGSAKAVLTAPIKQLMKLEGVGELRAKSLKDTKAFALADQEMKYIQGKNVRILHQQLEQLPGGIEDGHLSMAAKAALTLDTELRVTEPEGKLHARFTGAATRSRAGCELHQSPPGPRSEAKARCD